MTGVESMKFVHNELENDTKEFFKLEDWKEKPKGHAIYDDEGNKKFECKICKAEFKQKQRLDNHIQGKQNLFELAQKLDIHLCEYLRFLAQIL